jgi:exodeoxyribonuclease-3
LELAKDWELLSWNVNGLRAVHRKGALKTVLELGADVVCLQETKAHSEQLPFEAREPKGYYSFFCSATKKKGYSGVAIYSKIEPDSVSEGLNDKKFEGEGRVITADYGSFVLINCYFPNGGASEERLKFKLGFYNAFADYAESYRRKGRKVIICGDVNTAHEEIDLARPKENSKHTGFLPIERAWIDSFLARGYFDSFRAFHKGRGHYTWWDLKTRARERNVGWRLDYFLVSENARGIVKGASILPGIHGSDHCPIGLRLKA